MSQAFFSLIFFEGGDKMDCVGRVSEASRGHCFFFFKVELEYLEFNDHP